MRIWASAPQFSDGARTDAHLSKRIRQIDGGGALPHAALAAGHRDDVRHRTQAGWAVRIRRQRSRRLRAHRQLHVRDPVQSADIIPCLQTGRDIFESQSELMPNYAEEVLAVAAVRKVVCSPIKA